MQTGFHQFDDDHHQQPDQHEEFVTGMLLRVLTLIWRTHNYASYGSSFTLGSRYWYSTDNETPPPSLSDSLSVQKLSVYVDGIYI